MTAENWSKKLGHFVTSPPNDGSSSLGKLGSREPGVDEEWLEMQSTSSAGVVGNSLNSRLAAVLTTHVTKICCLLDSSAPSSSTSTSYWIRLSKSAIASVNAILSAFSSTSSANALADRVIHPRVEIRFFADIGRPSNITVVYAH